jgi:hypothetical protein
MKTSDKGKKERDALNNHATCWALQASEFARLIADSETRDQVYHQYTTVLLPDQLATDGSFPKELVRTKPYSYSIFNFDIMATLCQSLEGAGSKALIFHLPDGRGICKAAEFIYRISKTRAPGPIARTSSTSTRFLSARPACSSQASPAITSPTSLYGRP